MDIVGVKTKAYNLIDVAGKRVQLFDPIRDPMNLVDISDGHPEIVSEMMHIREEGWEHAFPESYQR